MKIYDLLGYQVRYEQVGYGKREHKTGRFRGNGRKMPDSWEKTCYAVFLNDTFLGVLNGCRCKWYLISTNREQDSPRMTSGLSRNDAVLAYINAFLL